MALSMISKYKQPGYKITTGAQSAPMSTPKIMFQGKQLNVGDTWSHGGQNYEMTAQGSRVVQPQQQQAIYGGQQEGTPAAVANQTLASLYGDTLNELRAAQERQYAATKARDEELRKGYEERKVESMKMLEGMGAQERADIESSWAGKESQAKQDMLSRGLMGTTVSPTVLAGYQRGAKEDVGRLEERLRNQRLGVYGQMTADQLGQIERVSDIPPDTGRYMQLMQQLGQAQAMAEPQGPYATPVEQSSRRSYTTTVRGPKIGLSDDTKPKKGFDINKSTIKSKRNYTDDWRSRTAKAKEKAAARAAAKEEEKAKGKKGNKVTILGAGGDKAAAAGMDLTSNAGVSPMLPKYAAMARQAVMDARYGTPAWMNDPLAYNPFGPYASRRKYNPYS